MRSCKLLSRAEPFSTPGHCLVVPQFHPGLHPGARSCSPATHTWGSSHLLASAACSHRSLLPGIPTCWSLHLISFVTVLSGALPWGLPPQSPMAECIPAAQPRLSSASPVPVDSFPPLGGQPLRAQTGEEEGHWLWGLLPGLETNLPMRVHLTRKTQGRFLSEMVLTF